MSDDHARGRHQRFEELAVGHVLGGLDPSDATSFRAHLGTCRACRTRVAELRGIADDLAAAEREERTRSVVRTAMPRRTHVPDAQLEGTRSRIGRVHVWLLAFLVVGLLGGLSFWNLHLRSTSAAYQSLAESHGEALEVLAAGQPLGIEVAGLAEGRAAQDDAFVAFTVDGLAQLEEGTWLVAWLQDGALERPGAVRLAGPGQLEDGAVAATLEHQGAGSLIVTRESGGSTEQPRGPEVVRIELPPAEGSG